MGSVRSAVARGLMCLAIVACGLPLRTAASESGVLWITQVQGKSLSFPCDIAVDRKGVAFLLDSGNRTVYLFAPGGEFIREIQGGGNWKDPVSLAVSADGMLFLADGDSGRVLEVDLSGKIRREYSAGKESRVTGVATSGEFIYCADNRNARVVVFRRGGGRAGGWGKKGDRPGEFHAPFRVSADPSGRVFVSDVLNGRIQWFSAFGKHLGTLKAFGAGQGKIFRPTGIGLDSLGRIWVSDSFTGLVQLFQLNGAFVRALQDGGRLRSFLDPVGVAEGPGGIWVADQREGRAALFRKEP